MRNIIILRNGNRNQKSKTLFFRFFPLTSSLEMIHSLINPSKGELHRYIWNYRDWPDTDSMRVRRFIGKFSKRSVPVIKNGNEDDHNIKTEKPVSVIKGTSYSDARHGTEIS